MCVKVYAIFPKNYYYTSKKPTNILPGGQTSNLIWCQQQRKRERQIKENFVAWKAELCQKKGRQKEAEAGGNKKEGGNGRTAAVQKNTGQARHLQNYLPSCHTTSSTDHWLSLNCVLSPRDFGGTLQMRKAQNGTGQGIAQSRGADSSERNPFCPLSLRCS